MIPLQHGPALVCDAMMPWGLGREAGRGPTLERLVAAGYDFVSLTLAHNPLDPYEALQVVAAQRHAILSRPESWLLVDTVDDIAAARDTGRLAISFNFQGTTPIGRNLHLLDLWHTLGIRQILLAYNARNFVADGCHDGTNAGLSAFKDGGYTSAPLTFTTPEQVSELADLLLQKNWPETSVRGVLGENWMRVWNAAWRASLPEDHAPPEPS